MAEDKPPKDSKTDGSEHDEPEVSSFPAEDEPEAKPARMRGKQPVASVVKKPAAKATPKVVTKPKGEGGSKGVSKDGGSGGTKGGSKGNAKAKSKAKSKAKAKPKAKAIPMKRPASKAGWKQGLEVQDDDHDENLEEELEDADDPEVEASGTFELDDQDERRKDRSKDTKFKNLLKNQCLPGWLADEWHRTSKMKSGRYEAQRMLVNAAIDRDPSGKLMLNPDEIELNKIKAGCCFCLMSLLLLLIGFACAGCFMCVIASHNCLAMPCIM